MTSDLNHEILSFVCRIKNGDSVTPDVLANQIKNSPEFMPTSIEYDGNVHVITVDF